MKIAAAAVEFQAVTGETDHTDTLSASEIGPCMQRWMNTPEGRGTPWCTTTRRRSGLRRPGVPAPETAVRGFDSEVQIACAPRSDRGADAVPVAALVAAGGAHAVFRPVDVQADHTGYGAFFCVMQVI